MSLGVPEPEISSPSLSGATRFSGPGMRYRPLIVLGQGGMADVHLAVGRGPSGFNKLVVLKSIRKELTVDEELRQMFLAEARVSARLNNANVVHVHEVLDTTLPCIVMEYLEGQPLSSVFREAGELFTLPLQLKVISETLAGLHYCHEIKDFDGAPLNLVHRDVSPQNIFVTYDGTVKVLDFGIAKASNSPSQTRTGIVKGKLAYMAPEQLLCGELDRRADIYSIGCILWHVAAGHKLWLDKNEGEIMRALIDGAIPKPSTVRPVDPALEEIVMKALAPEPSGRYSTALAMRRALDKCLLHISPGTNTREIGELVSEVFFDQQATRASEIRRLLKEHHSEIPPPPEAGDTIVQATLASSDTSFHGGKRSRRASHISRTLLFAASLIAVGAGGFAVWRGTKVQSAPSVTVVRPAASIQVRLVASPSAATLYVDGNAVNGNPASFAAPVDTRDHVIRATLNGFEPHQEVVRFDRDSTIEFTLVPEVPLPPAHSAASESARKPENVAGARKGRAAAAPSRTPVAAAKGTKDCDPPYTFENGIKTYKTGCLVTTD